MRPSGDCLQAARPDTRVAVVQLGELEAAGLLFCMEVVTIGVKRCNIKVCEGLVGTRAPLGLDEEGVIPEPEAVGPG